MLFSPWLTYGFPPPGKNRSGTHAQLAAYAIGVHLYLSVSVVNFLNKKYNNRRHNKILVIPPIIIHETAQKFLLLKQPEVHP